MKLFTRDLTQAFFLKLAYLATSFLMLIAIIIWQSESSGLFGSNFMLGWDSPNYVTLANILSRYGLVQSTGTWSYPHLYVQILAGLGYIVGNVTLVERVLPIGFAFLSICGGFLIALRISGNIHIAGISSLLQASSISFLKIFSDNNRNLMAISLVFVVMLIIQNAWDNQPKAKDYAGTIALGSVIAATQFETFAILGLTIVVCSLLTYKKRNISMAVTTFLIPLIALFALFPTYFLTYFQTPIQTPNQSLSTSDATYWLGGSLLLVILVFVGCGYALSKWRRNGSTLSGLLFVWSTILILLFVGVYAGLIPVQAEFGVRSLLLIPSYLLIPLGVMLCWAVLLRILKGRTLPFSWLSSRRIAGALIGTLLIVVLVTSVSFGIPQSSNYINTFIPTTTYNKIAIAANYVKQNNLGVPIILFEGSYDYADLERSYFGAILGENFAYYGELSNLLQLKPTESNASGSYQHYWEDYISNSYLQELLGRTSPPSEYVHQSYVTSSATLGSHPIIIVTPDLYDLPLPGLMVSFQIGSGVYVVPPGGLANPNATASTSNVTISRDGVVASISGVYTSVDAFNPNIRFLVVNASRGFSNYNVTSFPSDWSSLGIDQGGYSSSLDFSPVRPNGVPAVVGNDFADSLNSWTAVPANAAITVDSLNKMEGSGSLRVNGTGDSYGNVGSVLSFPPTDYGNFNTISFWAKCLSCSTLTVKLSDSLAREETFFGVEENGQGQLTQFSRFSVNITSPSAQMPGFDIHSVSSISFLAQQATQLSTTLWVDDVVLDHVISNPTFLYKGRVLPTDDVEFRFEQLDQTGQIQDSSPIASYPGVDDVAAIFTMLAGSLALLALTMTDRFRRKFVLFRRDQASSLK